MNRYRTYLEKSLIHFSSLLQESVFAEEISLQNGWLQPVDPRIKVGGFFLLILAGSFSHSIIVIAGLFLLAAILAAGSGILSVGFIRRMWFFVPLYTILIALPALFLTPGDRIAGSAITQQGVRAAVFLVLRVATSVSFLLLMILTTRWTVLLKSLRWMGVPHLLVFMLAMTHRYIYVLLQTISSLFLARQSRKVGPEAWRNAREWLGAIGGVLLGKSYSLSSEVYLAMVSRGFQGEPVLLSDFKLRRADWFWLLFFFCIAAISFFQGYIA
jgi:cobalt/nickel transport system permease protein